VPFHQDITTDQAVPKSEPTEHDTANNGMKAEPMDTDIAKQEPTEDEQVWYTFIPILP
jgi:hypothetical protein